ncbi:hypothetical protein [Bacillus halotolerans]|uniref:Uncharacterized protein n=1 Tax=Bacillus halotolerans TaxID=260554 RepID=A0A9Q6A4X3_9BACI|nr:hypothetical protein [Bacillus halotolerans]MBV7321003.1 hypothetical protein [Halalkalibacterium halodurans]AZV48703.1 hypothetical protein DIC78_06460 [Bacillus halotolerans]PLS04057.1 hypothetical protein CUU63_20080 [Bacillus halotolerans]QNS21033.1 hypothetical protein ICJ61_04180 [Bacillus halotolerans]QPZ41132.1 hypothetical protein I7X10_14520 [Bacillus halotolerans]
MKFKLTLCAVIALIGVSFISSSLGNEVNVASRNMTSKAANDSTNSLADKAIFDRDIMIAKNGTLG